MTPEDQQRKFDTQLVPLTDRQSRGIDPIVKNAVTCRICGSPAARYIYTFECQTNSGHVADLMTGIFSDLTPPERA